MRVLSGLSKERSGLSVDLPTGKLEIEQSTVTEIIASYIQNLRLLKLRDLLFSGHTSLEPEDSDYPSGIAVSIVDGGHPALGMFGTTYDLILDQSYFIDREFLVNPIIFLERQHVLTGQPGDDRQKGVSFGFIGRQNQEKAPLTSDEAKGTMEFLGEMLKNKYCTTSLEWWTNERWVYADELRVLLEEGDRAFRLEFDDFSSNENSFSGRYKVYFRDMAFPVGLLTAEEEQKCLEGFYKALLSPATTKARIRHLPHLPDD